MHLQVRFGIIAHCIKKIYLTRIAVPLVKESLVSKHDSVNMSCDYIDKVIEKYRESLLHHIYCL